MMKTLFKIFPVLPLIFFGACTNSDMAGGTTETENTIAKEEAAYVSIQVYSGKKPAKASYRVLPSWFVTDSTGSVSNDDFTYAGKTDSLGNIRIDNHQEGSYTIQIEQGDSALVYQYTINSLRKKFTTKAYLQKKGSIKGWLSLPEGEKYAWVNLEGIGRVVKTDSLGFFVAEGLPVGQISVKSWSSDNAECIGEANIETQSGESLHIGHVLAPSKAGIIQSLEINPTDLISDWMRPLSDPFVLTLRLDSTNFNFSKAREDGSDLQLFTSKGAAVPMVIDSWDPDIKSASINIRLESLKDTADTWTLEYGNPDAEAPQKVNVWKGISDSLWYELNSIENFNFESVSSRNDLPSPLRRESWYIQLHKKDTLTDSVTTSFIDATGAITTSSNWNGGNVLHINYKVDYPDIVVFGTHLTYHRHDWSRMDSLVVWMKTDGDFEIILESLDDTLNYKASYKGKGKGLTEWKRYCVKPEDFTYKIRDYHGWDIVRNKITNFTIFTYNSTELWLDNVRAYGVNRDDLK